MTVGLDQAVTITPDRLGVVDPNRPNRFVAGVFVGTGARGTIVSQLPITDTATWWLVAIDVAGQRVYVPASDDMLEPVPAG